MKLVIMMCEDGCQLQAFLITDNALNTTLSTITDSLSTDAEHCLKGELLKIRCQIRHHDFAANLF